MVRNEVELRKLIEYEASFVIGKSNPLIALPHLENAIRLYNELYSFKKPSLEDKAGFVLLKSQYRILCGINRRKPDKKILDGGYDGKNK